MVVNESFFWKVLFLLQCKLAVSGSSSEIPTCAKFNWEHCVRTAGNSCKEEGRVYLLVIKAQQF